MLDTPDSVRKISDATPHGALPILARARQEVRQLAQDLNTAHRSLVRDRHALLVIDLALLPWLAAIIVRRDINVWMPLAEIGGIILVYWLLTRGHSVETLPVRWPIQETLVALSLAALWVLYRIAQYAGLIQLPALKMGFCDDFADTIIPKMTEMVLLPLAIWFVWRYRPREIGLGVPLRAWIPSMVPLLVLLAWGISHHTIEALANRTACFYLGAGLPEELLFRAILQPRLELILKRPLWGLYLGAMIFGATHLPINLHGGGIQNWPDAFLNAFTFQAGIGLALGYAFLRVRNIWPLTAVHALIDSAP